MSTIFKKQKEENNSIKNIDFKLNNREIIFRGGEIRIPKLICTSVVSKVYEFNLVIY